MVSNTAAVTEKAEASNTAGAPERGTTIVRDRVREQLIERAVLSVPGVVEHRGMVPGRHLPAITTGDQLPRPIVDVEIATQWPLDRVAVVNGIQKAVTRELQASLAETPDRVNVRISRIDSSRTPVQVSDAYTARQGEGTEARAATSSRSKRQGPRGTAGSTVTGLLVALGFVAAGVAMLRDVAVYTHWVGGSPWSLAATRQAGQLHWTWWTWPAAVLAAAVGLSLIILAVKPRRRTYISVGDDVWVPRPSISRWQTQGGDPKSPAEQSDHTAMQEGQEK